MFPELWRRERLEPHKPQALLLAAFDGAADTRIDISSTLELKLRALRAHASQLSGDFESFVRSMARGAAKGQRFRYAETFRLVRLEEPPPPRRTARQRT
jgi:LmbE family N-acetylglucosaminyl deacetylase